MNAIDLKSHGIDMVPRIDSEDGGRLFLASHAVERQASEASFDLCLSSFTVLSIPARPDL